MTPGTRILATYPSAVQGFPVALKMALSSLDILLKVIVEDRADRPVFDSSVRLTGIIQTAAIMISRIQLTCKFKIQSRCLHGFFTPTAPLFSFNKLIKKKTKPNSFFFICS